MPLSPHYRHVKFQFLSGFLCMSKRNISFFRLWDFFFLLFETFRQYFNAKLTFYNRNNNYSKFSLNLAFDRELMCKACTEMNKIFVFKNPHSKIFVYVELFDDLAPRRSWWWKKYFTPWLFGTALIFGWDRSKPQKFDFV